MQPTYTPTEEHVAPAYGQQGAGVLNFQRQLNQKNAGLSGYKPIAEDGKYGLKTQAAAGFNPSNIVTTSSGARGTYNKNSAALDSALNAFNIGSSTPSDTTDASKTDPYLQSLDKLAANSDASTKMLISNIQAAKQRSTNTLDTQYNNYKSGLQLLGIQHNDAQSTPELLLGHVQQAENEHQDKIAQLNAEEAKATMDATNAKAEQDFKTLDEKMKYIKQIQADKADALKSYYDSIGQQAKVAPDIAHNIYQTLQTLGDEDKQAFIQQVAQQFKLPLGALVTALNDEKLNIESNQVKLANSKATLNKKTSTGNGASGSISKAQVSAGAKALEASRGADNYVDPYFYHDAYKNWIKNGGSQKTFISNFPPKLFVNPAATNLPDYLMPPKKTTGRSA